MPLKLCQIDPARNRFRCYRMSVQKTLFGEMNLVIHWGRIGSPLRMRVETFSEREHLEERQSELVRLRLRHGYSVVQGEVRNGCGVMPVVEGAGRSR